MSKAKTIVTEIVMKMKVVYLSIQITLFEKALCIISLTISYLRGVPASIHEVVVDQQS